jgi:hypothetical protein
MVQKSLLVGTIQENNRLFALPKLDTGVSKHNGAQQKDDNDKNPVSLEQKTLGKLSAPSNFEN